MKHKKYSCKALDIPCHVRLNITDYKVTIAKNIYKS